MKVTYTTPNPHGYARELLLEELLRALEREEEAPEDQPEG